MKKGFLNSAKKAQIALAVMAAVGCSFVGAGDVFANGYNYSNSLSNDSERNQAIVQLDGAIGNVGAVTNVTGTNLSDKVATLGTAVTNLNTAVGSKDSITAQYNITKTNGVTANLNALDIAVGSSNSITAQNNISNSNDVKTNLNALDIAVGSKDSITAQNNISNSNDVTTNLNALDTAIGSDEDIESENHITAGASVNSNLSALDAAIGSDDSITAQYNISNDNDIKTNLNALDIAIGSDDDIESENHITSGASVNSNLSALDAAIGSDDSITAQYSISNDNDIKTNLNALDINLGAYNDEVTANNIDTLASAKANISALDTALGAKTALSDIKDVNGQKISENAEGGAADYSFASAITAVNDKVGDLTANGNNITKGKTVNENLTTIDGAIGNIRGLEISDKDGNKKSGLSVTDAVDTVNTKLGDLNQNATYSNIEYGKSVSDNLTALDAAVGTTADGKYVRNNNTVGQNLNALDTAIDHLDSKIGKVGAGAAALAALHPLDFDPDDKLTFAAGYGNYQGENSVALGAFYRPDEKVMFSVAGNMGNGENMVNAGVSFALDRTHKTTTSKAVMAKKIEEQNEQIAALNDTVAAQSREIAELKAMVQALAAKK